MSKLRKHSKRLTVINNNRENKLVVKRAVKSEAYKLFKYIYTEWKHNSNMSFRIPRPVSYSRSEAVLKRTWIHGKKIMVVYFLTPECLSRVIYGIKPSIFAEKSAEFLAWLHSLQKLWAYKNTKELQQRHVTEMKTIVNKCFKSRLIDKNIAKNIECEINKTSEYDAWGPVSLIHGDFKTQNILIAEKNLAIIDFESLRYDFSYLDLSRFVSNVKLRSSKYPLTIESHINSFTSMFLKKYEKLSGKIDKRALSSCYLHTLLKELKTVLCTYSVTARSIKTAINNFLIRRDFNYLVKEILVEYD